MNGNKARALRKEAYGDLSQREDRQYVTGIGGARENHPDSPRRKYQLSKKKAK